MKNYIKYIGLMLVVCLGSCEDEDTYPLPPTTRGSIPVFEQGANDTGFIDFMDLDATNLSFNVDRQGAIRVLLPMDRPDETIAADIRSLLRG